MIQEVWHGDCLELMDNIPDDSVDMILCDLPYGTTACKWDTIIPFESLWKHYNRIVKDNGAILLFSTQPFTTKLIHSNIKKYKHYWIWDKEISGSFVLAKCRPMTVTEEICVFSSGNKVKYYPIMEDAIIKNIRPVNFGSSSTQSIPMGGSGITKSDKNYNPKKRYPKNIIKYSKYNAECNQLNRVHPTQKPIDLLEYLIKTYTQEGDLVLDNCAGSGSTLVAAKNLNRQFIGIEKEKQYYDICLERLKNS